MLLFFISKSPGGYVIYCRNARVLEMQNFKRESLLITISDQEKYYPAIKEINREICTELYNYTRVVIFFENVILNCDIIWFAKALASLRFFPPADLPIDHFTAMGLVPQPRSLREADVILL